MLSPSVNLFLHPLTLKDLDSISLLEIFLFVFGVTQSVFKGEPWGLLLVGLRRQYMVLGIETGSAASSLLNLLKPRNLCFVFWPWFLGHTQSSSGLKPGSMLRDYSWWVQGTVWGVGEWSPDWFLCKAIASFTTLSLSPSQTLSLRNLFLIAFR